MSGEFYNEFHGHIVLREGRHVVEQNWKRRTIGDANTINTTATKPRKITLYKPVIQTARSARSGFEAPRFCPTI